jgi:hypothetical protein
MNSPRSARSKTTILHLSGFDHEGFTDVHGQCPAGFDRMSFALWSARGLPPLCGSLSLLKADGAKPFASTFSPSPTPSGSTPRPESGSKLPALQSLPAPLPFTSHPWSKKRSKAWRRKAPRRHRIRDLRPRSHLATFRPLEGGLILILDDSVKGGCLRNQRKNRRKNDLGNASRINTLALRES